MTTAASPINAPVKWDSLDAGEQDSLLRRPTTATDQEVAAQAADIIAQVRDGGDAVLRQLSARIDGVTVDRIELSKAEIDAAVQSLDPDDLAAIDLAITNVRKFHEAQRPTSLRVETMPGICCERINHPLDSAGLYVPAGTAPLPSAAIMLAVPAAIAGCPVKILCAPPQQDGSVNATIVAAAVRSGVNRIFAVGGAQAIAAMAFGTESVPPVAKIFGPGNSWVTAAKSLVAGIAGGPAIDMPAGPSEVLVVADQFANPQFVASDLLSQAEHGEDSQAVLVTTSEVLASNVRAQLAVQLQFLSRRDIASVSLTNSPIVLVGSVETAISISNRYAPEHLILHTRMPRRYLEQIRNAGSVFLGQWAPESVGDYCSGTNHVLPTNGAARSFSGLGVEQFMRHMTVQELTEDGLHLIAPAVQRLAALEGLDAHANAVRCRLNGRRSEEQAG